MSLFLFCGSVLLGFLVVFFLYLKIDLDFNKRMKRNTEIYNTRKRILLEDFFLYIYLPSYEDMFRSNCPTDYEYWFDRVKTMQKDDPDWDGQASLEYKQKKMADLTKKV